MILFQIDAAQMHFGWLCDSAKWNSAIWDSAKWNWTFHIGR